MNNTNDSYWTSKYEQEQFPCLLEWWCTQAFFTTNENKKKWSFKSSFTKWKEKDNLGSILHASLLDKDKNEQYNYYSRDD